MFKIFLSCITLMVFSTMCTSKPKYSIEELEQKANRADERRDYQNAIKFYSQLIDKDSLNGQHYFGRAYSYSFELKIEESIKDYLKAAELNYDRGGAYFNIGKLHTYVKDSIALFYFEKALKEEPNNTAFKKEYLECLNRIQKRSLK